MQISTNKEDFRLFDVSYSIGGITRLVEAITREEVEALDKAVTAKRQGFQAQATWRQAHDHTVKLRWHSRDVYSIGSRSQKVLSDLHLWGLPIFTSQLRDIFNYVDNMEGCGASTKNKYMSEINVILEEAARVGMTETRLIAPRFARDLHKQGGISIARSDLKQMDAWFKDNSPIEINAFWQVLRQTGCRSGEALKLQWRDIADEWIWIHATKTGTTRKLPLPEIEFLNDRKSPNQRVFWFAREYFRKRYFGRMLKELDLEDRGYVPHSVRHTAASDLIEQGHSLLEVKLFMGHSSINTTLKYVHTSGDKTRGMRVR